MKKTREATKRIMSCVCALLLAITLLMPSMQVQAAEGVQITKVELSGGAVVFHFSCSGDELYRIVQAGMQVDVGEKNIPYEPNYSYFGYNNNGTYIKSGDGIYLYPSDLAEGDNIVSFTSDVFTGKIGVRKTTTEGDWWTKVYTIETFEVAEEEEEPQEPEEPLKNLFIRLVGAFESKMVGEEEIDAVSSATTATYLPQNTNSVKLEAALTSDAEEAAGVAEEDWHELSLFTQEEGAIRVNDDPMKTRVVIEPECEGVTGSYNIFTGDVILSGTPKQAGTYKVYVEFTDTEGRTATSNAVDFTVNAQDEKLVEHLTLENCTKTPDGKYIYDQEPWYMPKFGADTVVVPKEIKAWFGSHTMGTYSEIGEIISLTNGEEPKQTLVIPSGCDLTLINCRVHSGVKIVVEDGAKLTLRQSTVEGIVEVKKGATFSCDHVDYGEDAGFIYGSTVNGQLRFEDGSIMENCRIISKTNYSARDDINRKNQDAVVVVEGNVNVKGDVYILASEAPNGSYGQTGLLVKGTLNIPSGSTVAVYGGGESHLTAKGGDAIVMENGLIQGRGNLIAVGGYGMNITGDRSLLGGGAAIKGDGSLDVRNVYLESGSSFDQATKPVQGKLLVSNRSDVTAVNGQVGGITSPTYWHGTGDENLVPKIPLYFDEAKLAPEEEPEEKPQEEPAKTATTETATTETAKPESTVVNTTSSVVASAVTTPVTTAVQSVVATVATPAANNEAQAPAVRNQQAAPAVTAPVESEEADSQEQVAEPATKEAEDAVAPLVSQTLESNLSAKQHEHNGIIAVLVVLALAALAVATQVIRKKFYKNSSK